MSSSSRQLDCVSSSVTGAAVTSTTLVNGTSSPPTDNIARPFSSLTESTMPKRSSPVSASCQCTSCPINELDCVSCDRSALFCCSTASPTTLSLSSCISESELNCASWASC